MVTDKVIHTVNSDSSLVKTTREGRLYIKTSDFFKRKEVQEKVKKLMDSPIYIKIEKSKTK